MAQDAGTLYTIEMDQVIAETGTGGGGSESSATSEITHDTDQVMAETSTRERQTEPSDAGPSHTLEIGQVTAETSAGGSESSGTGAQGSTDIPKVFIPKVRKQLIVIDENSYTPHCVPIGPYHIARFSPTGIEEEKVRSVNYLRMLMEGDFEGLEEELAEPLVRACYSSMVVGDMTTEQWSTMLLHDGCYLLVCMVNYKGGNNVANSDAPDDHGTPASSNNATASAPTGNGDQETSGNDNNVNSGTASHGAPAASSNNDATAPAETGNDHVTGSCGVDNNTVVRDTVFLVDNQIPFFVLQKIHERVKGGTTLQPSSVLEPIADYVQEVLQAQLYISKHRRPAPTTLPSHLLHLVHFYLQPTNNADDEHKKKNAAARHRTGRWLRATEYCKYGNVWFKPRVFKDGEEWTFLDVHLEGDTLSIPRLQVDSMTWTVLRNLMALEEGTTQKTVTAYCVFMSQVAGTVEDVELLQRQEILEQFLVNNEEVAKGFANLCKGVVLVIDNDDSNYLKPIWHELRSLCTCWRYCLGSFRQKKCSDPVYIVAFVVAILVFLFELAQVILPLPKVQKHL